MAEALSGMTGALQGSVTGILNKGQGFFDRFFPPEKRAQLSEKISKFATEKPMLASFLLSQIALSGLPLGLFIIMTITVLVFAIVVALIIAVLGAVIFTVVAAGFALLILLPILFITTAAAAFIWLWGLGAYYILKWFNKKEIPGIHTSLKSDGGPLDLKGLTGEGAKADPKEGAEEGKKKGEKAQGEKSHEGKKTNGVPGGEKLDGVNEKVNGVTGKLPGGDKVKDVGSVGGLKDKANPGNVGKTVDGVKGSLPGL